MKRSLLAVCLLWILCFCMSIEMKAQNVNLAWAHHLGTTNTDNNICLATDASGNLLASGYIYQTVDFDPGAGVTNLTSTDFRNCLYVSKKDNAGNLLWAKQMGGMVRSMVLDSAGSIYLTGYFSDTVDFNPGTGSANTYPLVDSLDINYGGLYDAFVCKLDSSGNFVWAKQFKGASCYGNSITLDPSGNVCITGTFNGTVDFDPGTAISNQTAQGTNDAFICKLNASGNFVWAKSMGGPNARIGEGIANFMWINAGSLISADSGGNIIISGVFQDGTVDFDPGPGTATLSSVYYPSFSVYTPAIYVAKYTPSGNFVWAKQLADDAYGAIQLKAMRLDNTGNIHLAGNFPCISDTSFALDFDPGTGTQHLSEHTVNEMTDAFIVKLNQAGDFVWVKQFGGQYNDFVTSLYLDQDGQIYTTGYFRDTADFDPGINVASLVSTNYLNTYDAFVSKLDPLGNYSLAYKMGGGENDLGYAITVDATNSIYTMGAFSILADFDPDTTNYFLNSLNYAETFVAKYNQCSTTTFDTTIAACDSFILNNETYTQSGTYTQMLVNTSGCDSVITLHLNIGSATTGTSTVTACNSYSVGNQTFTSSGTYTQTLTSAFGCDSVVTLNLTVKTVDTSVTLIGNTLDADQIGATYQWINCNGNIPVPGATSQSFTPTANGSYAAVITYEGCTDTSACYAVNITDINEEHLLSRIQVYPNPSAGKVSIDFGNNVPDAIIRCIYVNGQTVIEPQKVKTNILTIDLGIHPDGIYFLEIFEGKRTSRIKVIKE